MDRFLFPPPPPPPPSSSTSQPPQSSPANTSRYLGEVLQCSQAREQQKGPNWHNQTPPGRFVDSNSTRWGDNVESRSTRVFSHGSERGAPDSANPRRDSEHRASISSFGRLPAGSHINTRFQRDTPSWQESRSGIITGNSGVSDLMRPSQNEVYGLAVHTTNASSGVKRKRKPENEHSTDLVPLGSAPCLVAPGVLGDSTGSSSNRKENSGLGLTPQNDSQQVVPSDDEHEDDVDEEAQFAELGANLTFEHNGVVRSLNTAADLASWRRERAQNFPTKGRVATKLAEQRKVGEERERLLRQARSMLSIVKQARNKAMGGSNESSGYVQSPGAVEESDLRTQARRVTLDGCPTRSRQNDTTNASSELATPGDSKLNDDSKGHGQSQVMISSRYGSNTQLPTELGPLHTLQPDSTPESDPGSDSGPEQIPFHAAKSNLSSMPQAPCKYFVAAGKCRNGNSCRYEHSLRFQGTAKPSREVMKTQDQEVQSSFETSHSRMELPPKRTSIRDRLIEQEQNDEHLLALQVIKFLGAASIFTSENTNDM